MILKIALIYNRTYTVKACGSTGQRKSEHSPDGNVHSLEYKHAQAADPFLVGVGILAEPYLSFAFQESEPVQSRDFGPQAHSSH